MFDFVLQSAPLSIAVAFLFGLLVGSFLNVVILRLPPRLEWEWRRDSREVLGIGEPYEPAPPGIVVERSACPRCGHRLAAWENVPLLSFVLLRGRCRGCRTAISWQYPVVELLTALMFAACIWRFGASSAGALGLVFSAFLVALSGIDLRTTLLPDQLTLPLLWLGLLASLVTVYVDPVSSILGASVGYVSLWSVTRAFKWATGKDGMGAGDFKLLAALGAWCGVKAVLPIILLSSLVGAIVGSLWLLLKGKDRDTQIPFGQYLAAAGWIQFISGMDLFGAYLDWAVGGR